MDSIHETSGAVCRFLDESMFAELHRAFIRAFGDYVMPFDLTEEQFRNHIILNAVDIASSIGAFVDGQLVGFSMNGFGDWDGDPTVYDAGTGVFPEFRRRGLSEKMFRIMLPLFSERGFRQCLLEVITTNSKAVPLYEKLGFRVTRVLSLIQAESIQPSEYSTANVELRDIGEPDWNKLRRFWDGRPSWQNSTDAIDRSRGKKCFVGAFIDETCVGYIVFSEKVGRVAQMAVDPANRRRGIGQKLLESMSERMSNEYKPQVINIDRSIESAMEFFSNRGFTEKLSQFEMLRPI